MSKEVFKKWTALIKSESKKSNWKFKEYFTFKIEGDYLFDAMYWINGKTNSLTGVFRFKFARIDDLFWELTVDNEKMDKCPLSLRVNGSHMVRPINYYYFELKDISEDTLINLLKTINDKVAEVQEKFSTVESYLKYIRENKVLNEYSYLTNLLFCKKYDELLFFIEYCLQNNITSGMSFSRNGKWEDYFDRLIKYIHANKSDEGITDENETS